MYDRHTIFAVFCVEECFRDMMNYCSFFQILMCDLKKKKKKKQLENHYINRKYWKLKKKK